MSVTLPSAEQALPPVHHYHDGVLVALDILEGRRYRLSYPDVLVVQPGQDREPDRWIARPRGDSSSRRHFVECERETRRAIAAGERDMLAQHTDESFRADDVSFRNAGGAVVQVLMRSDFFATEAFFCDHGRHPFLERRHVRYAGGDLVYSPTSIFPDHPSVAPHLHSLIVVHPSPSFDSTFWRKRAFR